MPLVCQPSAHPDSPLASHRLPWRRRPGVASLTAALVAAAAWGWLAAAAGDFDPSFGTGGVVLTDVPGVCCEEPSGVAVQPDGKIVVAGTVWDLADNTIVDTDFALVRYTADGSLDPAFGNGGVVLTKFATGAADGIRGLAIQPDGRIVVAGNTRVGPIQQFAVARYLPDGLLDTTFSTDGKAAIPLPFNNGEATSLALQPDGRVIIAGWVSDAAFQKDFALVRLNADGSLDASFGNSGLVQTPIATGDPLVDIIDDIAQAVVVQADGWIIAGGFTWNANLETDMVMARYSPDGKNLDPAFGTGGIVRWNYYTRSAEITGLILQPDGRIVAAGTARNPNGGLVWEFALARFLQDGTFDTTFGGDGKVTTRFEPLHPEGAYDAQGRAVALQSNGRIVLVGNQGNDIGIARYQANGALDTSFSGDGRLVTDAGLAGLEVALAVAIQPDGKPVIAGRGLPLSGGGGSSRFLTLRLDGGAAGTEAQTIDFASLADRVAGDPPFDVFAMASSGLPVRFTASGVCTIATATVTLTGTGTCSITASQDGDDVFAPALDVTRAFQVSGDRTPTTTTLASSANPSEAGQSVMFTATVAGAGGTPTGSVQFRDSGVALESPVPLVNGQADLPTSGLTTGPHTITAEYIGDPAYAPSTSAPLQQVVNPAAASVALSSSLHPSSFGDLVTFTASVTGFQPGGTIDFFADGAPVGTGAMVGGQATVATSTLAAGDRLMTATYSGDLNNTGAVSTPLVQTVVLGNEAPTVQPIGDRTIVWGHQLSVTVVAADPENDSLTYSLVNPPAGATITQGGLLTWLPASTQIGPTTLTVRISDGIHEASTSFLVTVSRRVTRLTYTGPLASAPGLIAVAARLDDVGDGSGSGVPLAARVVQFTIGTQSASTATLADGVASTSVFSSQVTGEVTGAASFAGDPEYQPSATPFVIRLSAAPVLQPVPNQTVAWGQLLSVAVSASDPDGDPLVFSLLNPPAGATIDAASGLVSWTPSAAQVGGASIIVQVTDGASTASTSFIVDVRRRLTAIQGVGPASAVAFESTTFSATLIDEFGLPVVGQTLTFEADAASTTATTAGNGAASGQLTIAKLFGSTTLAVSFLGTPAYAPAFVSQALSILPGPDTDGDGLPDRWETDGLVVDGVFLDLPAMGANPLRKDVFVHVDWMVRPPTCVDNICWGERTFAPQPEALAVVRAAFALAPVPNPDGSLGISLHVDAGPGSVMNPLTNQLWGALARGGEVPHVPIFGADFGGAYDWTAFDQYKQMRVDRARQVVFRYAIHVDQVPTLAAVGFARGVPAADFVIVAGHPDFGNGMTIAQERGVSMHELGHTLGLLHGGGDDLNNKPNYTSVMNYRWTLPGVPPDGRSDFSPVIEPPIDEGAQGDVNLDGRIDVLVGYFDWANLRFDGGGIGGLLAAPPPTFTPIGDLDPQELRELGVFAAAGDGAVAFLGPTALVPDAGIQSMWASVTNPSMSAAEYSVEFDGELSGLQGTVIAHVAAGGISQVSVTLDTTGLVPGEYDVTLRLRRSDGTLLHTASATVVVLDLSTPESRQAALEAAAQLGALGPESGLDPAVRNQLIGMLTVVEFYEFDGFFAPIEMSTSQEMVWNRVKAGQAIPLKWRLTMSGLPVVDAASFVGVFSSPVSCTTQGSVEAIVEETAPANSALVYLGDGQWQFNWKTLASYRNTCRTVVVRFQDGTESPPAHIKFR